MTLIVDWYLYVILLERVKHLDSWVKLQKDYNSVWNHNTVSYYGKVFGPGTFCSSLGLETIM